MKRLREARQRFLEIDTRFGQLGPRGIFQSLDGAGLLHHRVNGHDNVRSAMSEPPADGRARIRGEAIRRLAKEPAGWRCDWQYIVNSTNRRMLDLSNPFATEESWTQSTEHDGPLGADRLHILSYLETLRRRAER
jgi:hypothetical protein